MKNPSTTTLIDTVEHLQAISHLSEEQWLDLLQVTWQEYYGFRSGQSDVSRKRLEPLAKYFGLSTQDVLEGRIDFQKIARQHSPLKNPIPEQYLQGAHGRMRSTITSIEFLENKFGWRLKQDVLKRFELAETSSMDAFSPISMQLITDMCGYLRKRQFTENDFFQMGAYSFDGNKQSIVGRLYSEMPSYREAFEAFATVMMPMFEKNCTYSFEMQDEHTGIVHSRSNPDVAAELKVRALGNPHVCHVKAGIWASIVLYFGMRLPKVTHPQCEHRGDASCKYVFNFEDCGKNLAGTTKLRA